MSESNYDDFENYNDVVSRWASQIMITLNCFWMSESNHDNVVSGWACQTMITLFLDERVKL